MTDQLYNGKLTPGWLQGLLPVQLQKALVSEELCAWFTMLCRCILKFLIFDQGALYFHFALGPTNYVAHPANIIGFPECESSGET